MSSSQNVTVRAMLLHRQAHQACVWQETLPYDAGTLRHRIAGGSPTQLQDMQEALEQRARELTAEIIALAVPDTDYRGSVRLTTRVAGLTITQD